MYGIFTYIWVIYGVNVGKYSSTMDPMGFTWLESHLVSVKNLGLVEDEALHSKELTHGVDTILTFFHCHLINFVVNEGEVPSIFVVS